MELWGAEDGWTKWPVAEIHDFDHIEIVRGETRLVVKGGNAERMFDWLVHATSHSVTDGLWYLCGLVDGLNQPDALRWERRLVEIRERNQRLLAEGALLEERTAALLRSESTLH